MNVRNTIKILTSKPKKVLGKTRALFNFFQIIFKIVLHDGMVLGATP